MNGAINLQRRLPALILFLRTENIYFFQPVRIRCQIENKAVKCEGVIYGNEGG